MQNKLMQSFYEIIQLEKKYSTKYTTRSISLENLKILKILQNYGNYSIIGLATMTLTSKATTSSVCRLLIKKGYIKVNKIQDRRYKILSLTDKGLAFISKIDNFEEDINNILQASLSNDEKILLDNIITKLINTLKEMNYGLPKENQN